mmetsp:Transcript_43291/g.101057  ORF Transcript_43291/g.101057 Transcript_43291/m.101057 type:complete len:199 (-) Transcript_43291:34-630(-)
MDALPRIDLCEESGEKFRYLALSILGIWVAAVGRFAEGSRLGAENDLIPGAFGVWLFQNKFCCACACNGEDPDQPTECSMVPSGPNCLVPFGLVSAVNATFDFLICILVCPECFMSVMAADSTLCSGCFFTFAAAMFQTCSAILAWQIWRNMPESSGYRPVLQDIPPSLPPQSAELTEVSQEEAAFQGHTGAIERLLA